MRMQDHANRRSERRSEVLPNEHFECERYSSSRLQGDEGIPPGTVRPGHLDQGPTDSCGAGSSQNSAGAGKIAVRSNCVGTCLPLPYEPFREERLQEYRETGRRLHGFPPGLLHCNRLVAN